MDKIEYPNYDKAIIVSGDGDFYYIFGTVPKKVGLGRCENKAFLG